MRICICSLFISLCAFTATAVAQTTDRSISASVNHATGQTAPLRAAKVDVESVRAKALALRKLSEAKPDTPEARDAGIEEVFVLGRLSPTSEPELASRRRELVEKFSKDKNLPVEVRHRMAAFSANVDVIGDRSLDLDQRMEAFAQVAWRMAKDFPDQPDRYASLLRIAADSNDIQARTIAEDILAADAPEEIKAESSRFLRRLQLVGHDLNPMLGDTIVPTTKNPICLLAWSKLKPNSLAIAKFLKAQLPAQTVLLAICIEGDTPETRAVFAAQNIEAVAIFPSGGPNSSLCKNLFLYGPAVYLVDREGVITSVCGLNQLKKLRANKAAKEEKQ